MPSVKPSEPNAVRPVASVASATVELLSSDRPTPRTLSTHRHENDAEARRLMMTRSGENPTPVTTKPELPVPM